MKETEYLGTLVVEQRIVLKYTLKWSGWKCESHSSGWSTVTGHSEQES
jgi:hypothetical protein